MVRRLVTATYTIHKIEGRLSLNLCTCYPLTPGDLIQSAMCSHSKIVHSFCCGPTVNKHFCFLIKDLHSHILGVL